jgi:hypothetical protein
MAAKTRPEAASGPLVPPPRVYSPHGGAEAECRLEGSNDDEDGGRYPGSDPSYHPPTVLIATWFDHGRPSSGDRASATAS